jgi:hydroxyisourate hydrolase
VTLAELNGLDPLRAESVLLGYCGSRRWARLMTESRPFRDAEQLAVAADRHSGELARADWLEAFAAHPRIGAPPPVAESAGDAGPGERARQEQRGAFTAPLEVRERMASANRAYEARFGYIFIICASGRSGQEMLAECERRLVNGPAAELAEAAEEQRKITRLRLAATFGADAGRDRSMITTHVLDISRGGAAAGVGVVLEVRHEGEWRLVGRGTTDANGRLTTLTAGSDVRPGTYRLTFDTGHYFRAAGMGEPFFPEALVTFVVGGGEHYHVPLLLSPFGYSTYRGT